MKYRVVKITNNLDEYPSCEKDTMEFPELIDHVDDELDWFIVDENGNYWEAGDFFFMVEPGIVTFESVS